MRNIYIRKDSPIRTIQVVASGNRPRVYFMTQSNSFTYGLRSEPVVTNAGSEKYFMDEIDTNLPFLNRG